MEKRSFEKLERRLLVGDLRSLRAEGQATRIGGHAAVFDTPADLGYFIETVKRGAFTKTIAEDDVRALFNHDSNLVLGRNKAGTLRLSEDSKGLAFEVDLPDTQLARDLAVSIDRGDISQCSFGFMVRGEEVRRVDGVWNRDLTDVQLFDVSPVTYPAYDQTDVSMRSLDEIAKQFRSGSEDPPVDPEAWKQDFDHRRRRLLLAH